MGLHDFRCNLHVAVPCLISTAILLQNKFTGRTVWIISWTCCLLSLYIATSGPAVWLKLFAITVCCFLLVHIHGHHIYLRPASSEIAVVLLRENYSFVWRRSYFDEAFVPQAQCLGLYRLCSLWHHKDQMYLLTHESADCFPCDMTLVLFKQHQSFDPARGSHQLPVFNFCRSVAARPTCRYGRMLDILRLGTNL